MNEERKYFECAECEREVSVNFRTNGRPNVCLDCSKPHQRPPIGINARWLITEKRLTDIAGAIEKYKNANISPLPEWYAEFYDLHNWLTKYREENL